MKPRFITQMEKTLKNTFDDRTMDDHQLMVACKTNKALINILMKRFFPLMFSTYARVFKAYPHTCQSELWSACYHGLISAVDTFNPITCYNAKGVYHFLFKTLSCYCFEYVKGEAHFSINHDRYDEPIGKSDGGTHTLADILCNGEDIENDRSKLVVVNILKGSLETLTETQKFIVEMRSEGESIESIASVLGLSRQMTHTHYTNSLNKVRVKLSEKGINHNPFLGQRWNSSHLTIPTRIRKEKEHSD